MKMRVVDDPVKRRKKAIVSTVVKTEYELVGCCMDEFNKCCQT